LAGTGFVSVEVGGVGLDAVEGGEAGVDGAGPRCGPVGAAVVVGAMVVGAMVGAVDFGAEVVGVTAGVVVLGAGIRTEGGDPRPGLGPTISSSRRRTDRPAVAVTVSG